MLLMVLVLLHSGEAGHVYVYDANPERFAQFATNIFDIPCFADYENTALAGIEAMEDFFRSIHMPTNLHDLGLDLTDDRFMNWLSNAVLKIHVPLAFSNS